MSRHGSALAHRAPQRVFTVGGPIMDGHRRLV